MKQLISVIVPIFNIEEYLFKCVESILNQTYKNLEIILINDGSNDQSGKLCDQLAESDHRIKVIHTENKGTSEARNIGLKSANGSYIGFVDADDWIDPNMYELMYSHLIKYQADLVECDYNVSNNTKWENNQNIGVKVFTVKDNILKKCLENNFNSYIWCLLLKRDIALSANFKTIATKEDEVYKIETICQAKTYLKLEIPLYYYLERRGGSLSDLCFSDNGYNETIDHLLFLDNFWKEKQTKDSSLNFLINRRRLYQFSSTYRGKNAVSVTKKHQEYMKNIKELSKKILAFNYHQKGIRFKSKLEKRQLIYSSGMWIIFGTNPLAEFIFHYLLIEKKDVYGFIESSNYYEPGKHFCNKKVFLIDDIQFTKQKYNIVITALKEKSVQKMNRELVALRTENIYNISYLDLAYIYLYCW